MTLDGLTTPAKEGKIRTDPRSRIWRDIQGVRLTHGFGDSESICISGVREVPDAGNPLRYRYLGSARLKRDEISLNHHRAIAF
jgi:hypothetical protein